MVKKMKRQKKRMVLILMLLFCSSIFISISLNLPRKTLNIKYQPLDVRAVIMNNYESDFIKIWSGSSVDVGRCITLDDLGNIYITGYTYSFGAGNGDAFIAKFDSSGNSMNNITWGGNDYDRGNDFALDGSGNMFITGKTESFGAGAADAFIAKYDSSFNSVKNITWGDSMVDSAEGIALDGLGNIYITGYTNTSGTDDNDAFIAKFDSSGNSLKNITWGGSSNEIGYEIALDGSGNIYITGETESFGAGGNDAFIAKYNSTYDSVKNITWGGSDSDGGYDIALDGSGKMYITGYTESFGAGDHDAFITIVNSSGNPIINITWGDSDRDHGEGITLDDLGNIYITGHTNTSDTNDDDIFIAKFDNSRNSVKNITFGSSVNDVGLDIALDDSGNIYITGWTYTTFGDALLLKYKPHSNVNGSGEDDTQEGIPDHIFFLLIELLGILSAGIIISLTLLIKKRKQSFSMKEPEKKKRLKVLQVIPIIQYKHP